jgi:hypothetical protein
VVIPEKFKQPPPIGTATGISHFTKDKSARAFLPVIAKPEQDQPPEFDVFALAERQ